ncbi:MAG: bifunctional transaldolase/phosoglucose isomerase [Bacteroidetes bacterium]|nr:bifunctional transaldolase/phosoglucose isomerase [Bacteroidota bacterium]
MNTNPLLKLEKLGQSIWMDFIRRETILSGELRAMINEDGISGVTSNPSIFEKAIAGSHDYDSSVRALALEGKSVEEIYRELTVEDIKRAADVFRPLYEETKGGDGYVSLEVSPNLAHDAKGTIAEAMQLWGAVERPNIYIKVPGTREGLVAIHDLISRGINVNVTLLFGLPRYRAVAEAYVAGLEARAAKGESIDTVSSVASFFLSRIDVFVDKTLEGIISGKGSEAMQATRAKGEVAIASARIAYQMYKDIFSSERFGRLTGKGARKQRLLWASTSTKDPSYSDVKYVEALIGSDTVNTLPLETIHAYRDHGKPVARLEGDIEGARAVMEVLPSLGIDIDTVTQQLEDDGVKKFVDAYEALLKALRDKREAALHEPVDSQTMSLGSLDKAVRDRIVSLDHDKFTGRLWEKDPTLWKEDEASQKIIKNALGWLHVPEKIEEVVDELTEFASSVRKAGFRHVVHMGMGGSSLAPLVLAESFGLPDGGIPLTVLDTTDPATILKIEKEVPLSETLFIVASKSGTTAEPNAFGDYFYEKVRAVKGVHAGENFVAITDSGSKLIDVAAKRKYRKTFLNFSDIGGRYSALSYFGLVPAALLGVDIPKLLTRALRMARACDSCVPAERNPGVSLGAAMGELALKGKDKLTFIVSKEAGTLGLWLEQLVAESTGKGGKGILPVSDELVMNPEDYGKDRFFAYIKMKGSADTQLEDRVRSLSDAGHPVVTVEMTDLFDIAQEFFRWEIATATAGAVIGINAFDQPNVQESKDNTNRLLAEVRANGKLTEEEPSLQDGAIRVYGDASGNTLVEVLKSFFASSNPGDYVPFMAYVPEGGDVDSHAASMRAAIQHGLHLATTFGYGPRFLHSTGQYHKGGPNTGLFVQLTSEDTVDAPLPGQPFGFSVFKKAQALGDLEALRKHGRRVIRIDLGKDLAGGLERLDRAVKESVSD